MNPDLIETASEQAAGMVPKGTGYEIRDAKPESRWQIWSNGKRVCISLDGNDLTDSVETMTLCYDQRTEKMDISVTLYSKRSLVECEVTFGGKP